MFEIKTKYKKGFTLIELLVVISIIALLSSVAFVSFRDARMAASDKRKISDARQIFNALQLFYAQNNRMPRNYNGGNCSNTTNCSGYHPLGTLGGGTFTDPGTLSATGPYSSYMACDNDLPGFDPASDANTYVHSPEAYNATLQELVNAGIINKIPHSPSDSTYCYFDTGHTGNVGVMVYTPLVNTQPSKTPVVADCAPLTGLCSSSASPTNGFCLCAKY